MGKRSDDTPVDIAFERDGLPIPGLRAFLGPAGIAISPKWSSNSKRRDSRGRLVYDARYCRFRYKADAGLDARSPSLRIDDDGSMDVDRG